MTLRAYSTAELSGAGLDALRALGEVVHDPWTATAPPRLYAAPDLVARLTSPPAHVLVVEADFVGPEVVRRCPELALVVACRADPWNVDAAAATEAGVPVVNAPGRNAPAVAELALAITLALLRGLTRADADVRAGRWVVDERIAYQRFRGRELSGRTVGVVGLGAVGSVFARLTKALGCRVLAHDPYASAGAFEAAGAASVSLSELLSSADVVSLHATVTESSRHLIGAAELARMRGGAILVNTARAGLVDTDALVDALRSGAIAGAGIDHFDGELLPADHPLVSMPNVVLTPHIGGATLETVERHTAMAARAVSDVVAGRRPEHLVNPEVWPRRRELPGRSR